MSPAAIGTKPEDPEPEGLERNREDQKESLRTATTRPGTHYRRSLPSYR